MKKIITILIFAFTAILNLSAQQKTLKPVWLKPLRDTSFVEKQQLTTYPLLFLSLDKTNIIVSHSRIGGILTQQIREKDGIVNWEHRRSNIRKPHFNTLNKASGFTLCQLFERKDGNIDLLATADASFPPAYPIGGACRFVLDAKTGQEKAFYYPAINNKPTTLVVNHGSRQGRYLPINGGKDGYYMQTGRSSVEQTRQVTYRVDSLMMGKDTIIKVDTWKDSSNYVMESVSELLYTGHSFCHIASFYNSQITSQDTLGTQVVFFKYKKNNIQVAKALNTAFYNTRALSLLKKLDDGFLLAGRLSPKLSAENNNNVYSGEDNFVAKVDTNGNIVWRKVWAMEKEGYFYRSAVELPNKKGHFITAHPATKKEGILNLIYVSELGKTVKEFTIDLGENIQGINDRKLWLTKNGNLLYAYSIDNCDFDNPDPKFLCNGVFLLKGSEIDQILSDKTVEVPKSQVLISPNPARDNISLQFKEAQAGVATIFDVQGKAVQIFTQANNSEQWQIPLKINENGLYFVQIQLENGAIQTEKIVVQR